MLSTSFVFLKESIPLEYVSHTIRYIKQLLLIMDRSLKCEVMILVSQEEDQEGTVRWTQTTPVY